MPSGSLYEQIRVQMTACGTAACGGSYWAGQALLGGFGGLGKGGRRSLQKSRTGWADGC